MIWGYPHFRKPPSSVVGVHSWGNKKDQEGVYLVDTFGTRAFALPPKLVVALANLVFLPAMPQFPERSSYTHGVRALTTNPIHLWGLHRHFHSEWAHVIFGITSDCTVTYIRSNTYQWFFRIIRTVYRSWVLLANPSSKPTSWGCFFNHICIWDGL